MGHDLPNNSAKKLELSLEFFLFLKAHYLIHSLFAIPAKCTSLYSLLPLPITITLTRLP